VATQNPDLRKRFDGDPAFVVNLMLMLAREVREIMAELGFRRFDEMVGRSDCLEFKPREEHWKAKGLDLSPILYRPKIPEYVGRLKTIPQDHGLEESLDIRKLLKICKPALESCVPTTVSLPVRNTDRVVGTILGSEVTRFYGHKGLPENTLDIRFKGSAGQSFGAFLPPGITLTLEGDANDYLGKGLSGGRLIVFPPKGSPFRPEENVITGNVTLYGATRGEAYLAGIAGERFCVRNSGANAVVEGVGDHGCEYMTGGRVVILGKTGRNFAAGMSGGITYVYDPEQSLESHCNHEMIGLFPYSEMDSEEVSLVRQLIQNHINFTGSRLAWRILSNWDENFKYFVKVFPNDYRRVLEAEKQLAEGNADENLLMAAITP
jgi:glutamate synthase (ferredoxin)